MLFPYLPQMMRDFGYEEQAIGIYAGLVASSYFVGAFISSNFWGYTADSRGRKPVIVVCLFGTAVCTLCFGFSFNIYWAIASRCLVGVFNGIIGTTKAVLGDVSDDSNQAIGLAVLSVGWGSGILLGPSIGGYLSEPVKKYPVFAATELKLFESYPYLLPNLMSSLACFLMFTISLSFLPETKNTRSATSLAKSSQISSSTSEKALIVPVEVPEIAILDQAKTETVRPVPIEINEACVRPGPIEINEACLTGTSAVMKSEPSNTELEKDVPDSKVEDSKVTVSAICSLLADHKVAMATALFSIFSFSCVALDESIPLWAAIDTKYGGLGFSTSQLGTMTGAFNVPCLLINILVFPKLEKWIGCVRTFCLGSFVLFLTTIAIPFINELSDNKTYLWLTLVFVLVPNRMMYPICWSAADILINNSVYPKYLGLVNGLSMTFSFLARSASPLTAGSLFSWSISVGYETLGPPFGHHFVFFLIDVTILICFFIGLFTPLSLDKQPETWDLMEKVPAMKPDDLLKRLKEHVENGNGSNVDRAAGSRSRTPSAKLLEVHENEQRKVRLFNASFSNSLSFQGPVVHRPLRHFSGSATEDSSTNASRFLSAKENVSEDEATMHDPISPEKKVIL